MNEPDAALVKSLIGKHVLVGITYCSHSGDVIEQQQFHGHIVAVRSDFVELKHPDTGELFTLPPDLSFYTKAVPGEYRLRGSGEVVVNPDLLATWTVTQAAE